MAKKSKIQFNNSEIICLYKSNQKKLINKTKSVSLKTRDIHSVTMKYCVEAKGLKLVESERINIRIRKLPKRLEYYKYEEIDFFEEYKAGFRIFCRRNNISLIDEIE